MHRKFQHICKPFNPLPLPMFFLVFHHKIKKKKIPNKNDSEWLELHVSGLSDKKEGCVCNCLLINMNIVQIHHIKFLLKIHLPIICDSTFCALYICWFLAQFTN